MHFKVEVFFAERQNFNADNWILSSHFYDRELYLSKVKENLIFMWSNIAATFHNSLSPQEPWKLLFLFNISTEKMCIVTNQRLGCGFYREHYFYTTKKPTISCCSLLTVPS